MVQRASAASLELGLTFQEFGHEVEHLTAAYAPLPRALSHSLRRRAFMWAVSASGRFRKASEKSSACMPVLLAAVGKKSLCLCPVKSFLLMFHRGASV